MSETTLQEITMLQAELHRENEKRKADFSKWKQTYEAEKARLAKRADLLTNGIDLERRDRGLGVVFIHGRVSEPRRGSRGTADSRLDLVREAMEDIAAGGHKLKQSYFGMKNYEAFGDQRHDGQYGMGPRHGTIVFRAGLTGPARQHLNEGGELSPQEIEDALYVLATLEQSEKAAIPTT